MRRIKCVTDFGAFFLCSSNCFANASSSMSELKILTNSLSVGDSRVILCRFISILKDTIALSYFGLASMSLRI